MMHTESTPSTAAAGDLQGRIAAVTELLASHRSDHIEDSANSQGLDFFRALDASYVVYLTAKTPPELS